MSPTLFIVFMNDLVKQLPTFVKNAMYACDLVLWSTQEYDVSSIDSIHIETEILQVGYQLNLLST